ncbi:MAG: ABC transporter permease [Candidatus Aminicenantes bacterium]|nr:MAG: ABC transporter permease [Candidatus Aminicenantes bacterium]
MFINYLKIAYRNLHKHKFYSLINIFGLSLGIASCILIFAYIGYELSYDGYHKNASNIYRVISKRTVSGQTSERAISPAPVGPTMVEELPEVINAVRFSPTVKRVFAYKDKTFFEEGVLYVDQSIFDVFSFEMVEGDPKAALEIPFTMVFTEKTAQKYFGDESPVGKIINWDNKFDYRVTGVVKDPPPNSHFTFNALASFATFIKYDRRIGSWNGGSFQTYLLLQENIDLKKFEQKMRGFHEKYLGPALKERGIELETYLQPLKSIHLHSHVQYELGDNGDIRLIYAFWAIAVIILLIACINFMNLATARSAGRAKEVGMRKVLGAHRTKLVVQFLGESFVYALLSLGLGILVARLFLPYFSGLAGKDISLNTLEISYVYAVLAAIVLFVGFVAGSYPAFFLSAFKPISSLRGHAPEGMKSSWFRSILVVFQFALSIVLIICTIIVFNQHNYMQNKNLGFNKQDLLVVAVQNDEVRNGLESFKQDLLNISGIESAGLSSMVPGEMYLFNIGTYPEGYARDQMIRMDNFLVDYGFLDTFEIEVTRGRGFSKEMTTDFTDAVMINEMAAKNLGWNNPIGKTIEIPADDSLVRKTVIGVFKDIHQRSLYSEVAPTIIQYIGTEGPIENRARRLTIRLKTDDIPGIMKKIEQKWKNIFPTHPYYSFFLDEFFDGQHQAEEKLGGLFRTFSVLAIIIGSLGLFGLASFTTEKRTKEIGIRKVLGSSVSSIVILICRKFILLVGIANVLAWPMAYFTMNKWLQNFPYPVKIGISTFILTAVFAFVIALFTVGLQSFKAARTNPVDSLRYE